ncbi:MAG: hypothetical protein K6F76_03055 [Clostridiales bacterium]|nr:hypothetical protein [Clostridiales bacterium]
MVTEQEMKNRKFTCEFEKERVAFQVTSQEMNVFKKRKYALAKKIDDFVLKLEKELNCGRIKVAELVEENCQQSWDTYKKIISRRCKASRVSLYKFCIGMNLSREEADSLFELTDEGGLTDENIGDYIFARALGIDSIYDFIDEYEHYTGKSISMRERK